MNGLYELAVLPQQTVTPLDVERTTRPVWLRKSKRRAALKVTENHRSIQPITTFNAIH